MAVAITTLPNVGASIKPPTSPHQSSSGRTISASSSLGQASSASHVGKGRRKRTGIEDAAAEILVRIPGITKNSLNTWLYLARRVTDDANDDAYFDILEYVNNSQLHKFGIKVLDIVRIVRNNDVEFDHDRNVRGKWRMMLWHGTSENVVPKILEEGFRIPPNNGQMFGPGIYFADRVSKSSQYCGGGPNRNPTVGSTGYLFLCDVLLGKAYNAARSHPDWTGPPAGHDSVRCTGKHVPNREQNGRLRGSFMPKGETIVNSLYPHYAVQYNEYVVYSPDKVKTKYLVKVEFTDSRFIN